MRCVLLVLNEKTARAIVSARAESAAAADDAQDDLDSVDHALSDEDAKYEAFLEEL